MTGQEPQGWDGDVPISQTRKTEGGGAAKVRGLFYSGSRGRACGSHWPLGSDARVPIPALQPPRSRPLWSVSAVGVVVGIVTEAAVVARERARASVSPPTTARMRAALAGRARRGQAVAEGTVPGWAPRPAATPGWAAGGPLEAASPAWPAPPLGRAQPGQPAARAPGRGHRTLWGWAPTLAPPAWHSAPPWVGGGRCVLSRARSSCLGTRQPGCAPQARRLTSLCLFARLRNGHNHSTSPDALCAGQGGPNAVRRSKPRLARGPHVSHRRGLCYYY